MSKLFELYFCLHHNRHEALNAHRRRHYVTSQRLGKSITLYSCATLGADIAHAYSRNLGCVGLLRLHFFAPEGHPFYDDTFSLIRPPVLAFT